DGIRDLHVTGVQTCALPIFAVMYMLGYSLDNLSLMALTLAVGFVVDDAVVMLENIVRHLEMKKPPLEAATEGAREVGFTILSMRSEERRVGKECREGGATYR